MSISQDEANRLLEKHYEPICGAVVEAYDDYRKKYPHRTLHRRGTRANIVNDEILAKVIERFDDRPETKFVEDRSRGLRFLRVSDRLLLWFKKTNRQRMTRNYPTSHAQKLETSGQTRLFPGFAVLVVGYLLN